MWAESWSLLYIRKQFINGIVAQDFNPVNFEGVRDVCHNFITASARGVLISSSLNWFRT